METEPRPSTEPAPHALHLSVVQTWLDGQASANTRSAYRGDLEVFARWCSARGGSPLQADHASLRAFHVARRTGGDSPATLRRRWSALSSFFKSAVEQGARADDPTSGGPPPESRSVREATRDGVPTAGSNPTAALTAADVDRYRTLAAEIDVRLEALVSLLANDGLKLGEALALDVEHVAGRPPEMTVTVARRDGAVRLVLGEPSAAAVRRVAGRRRSGPLFLSARNVAPDEERQRLTRFGADHLIRQLAGGDDRITANAFRRAYSIARRAAGTELGAIRDRMGLADVRGVRRHLGGD